MDINVCTVLFRILKKCTGCIYSLVDLNMDQCVELTFFDGKLGGFFVVKV